MILEKTDFTRYRNCKSPQVSLCSKSHFHYQVITNEINFSSFLEHKGENKIMSTIFRTFSKVWSIGWELYLYFTATDKSSQNMNLTCSFLRSLGGLLWFRVQSLGLEFWVPEQDKRGLNTDLVTELSNLIQVPHLQDGAFLKGVFAKSK